MLVTLDTLAMSYDICRTKKLEDVQLGGQFAQTSWIDGAVCDRSEGHSRDANTRRAR